MQGETRVQKISRIAAKAAIRVFILVLFMGIVPFMTDNEKWNIRMTSARFVIPNQWTLIFPALLFLGLLALIIIVVRNKYKYPDYNWLLVLNTIILLAYLVMVYIRIYQLIFV